MASLEFSGKIIKVCETDTKNETFHKRDLILEIDSDTQYPQQINIQFNKDMTSRLDSFKEGDNVKVNLNLHGRKWTNKEGVDVWFNSLNGWKIEKLADTSF